MLALRVPGSSLRLVDPEDHLAAERVHGIGEETPGEAETGGGKMMIYEACPGCGGIMADQPDIDAVTGFWICRKCGWVGRRVVAMVPVTVGDYMPVDAEEP